MSRKPNKRPSFFKVLISTDFTRLLPLPPVFLEKYRCILPENVKLRISSGKTWYVKVEEMENGKSCFSWGWKNFAEDVGLKWGEFLVFKFDGKSMFDVSVYETNACEKEIIASVDVEDSDPHEDHVEELNKDECKTKNHNGRDVVDKRPSNAWKATSEFDQESNPLHFEIVLKPHHRSRISLAKKFCMAAGLTGKEIVGLEYVPEHRYQSVVLDYRAKSYRIDMARGWSDFRKENGLVFGETYSFEFRPSKNVIHVNEVKRGN